MEMFTVIIDHTGRLIGLERDTRELRTRVAKLERARRLPRLPWRQLLPALYGLTILILALIGKITWTSATSMLGPGH